MKKSSLLSSIFLCLSVTLVTSCDNQVGGTPQNSLASNSSNLSTFQDGNGNLHQVRLMPDTRSESQRTQDLERIKSMNLSLDISPKSISTAAPVYALGSKATEMNNVPVLDQGSYGTCVTYSTTAALDALTSLDKGSQGSDTISQNCFLSTDLTGLGGVDYVLPKGFWDGAVLTNLFPAVQSIGVLTKQACKTNFGFNTDDDALAAANSSATSAATPFPYGTITQAKYTTAINSDDASTQLSAQIQKFQINSVDSSTSTGNYDLLSSIKTAINNKHLVLLSFLIYLTAPEDSGGNIILSDSSTTFRCVPTDGSYKGVNVCEKFSNDVGGHEVVVVGYDDANQRLIIRNSWASTTGDNGDYYISYDYIASNTTNAMSEIVDPRS